MKVRSLAVLLLLGSTACSGDRSERLNVQPPAPGVPRSGTEVQGIYRSIHQGLLQLRGNGEINLITPDEPGTTSGDYSLREGVLEVRTDKCDDRPGTYNVEVTGEQKAGKAILVISAVHDDCAHRRRHLTIDPWVYADS